MKHNYLEPRADIRFFVTEDIMAASPTDSALEPEKQPTDDTVNDPF